MPIIRRCAKCRKIRIRVVRMGGKCGLPPEAKAFLRKQSKMIMKYGICNCQKKEEER